MEKDSIGNHNTKVLTVILSDELLSLFREMVAQEGSSVAHVVEQFMSNYVDYLDKSFLHGQTRLSRSGSSNALQAVVSGDIHAAFKKKTGKERVSIAAVIEQFVKNYVEFISGIHGVKR